MNPKGQRSASLNNVILCKNTFLAINQCFTFSLKQIGDSKQTGDASTSLLTFTTCLVTHMLVILGILPGNWED